MGLTAEIKAAYYAGFNGYKDPGTAGGYFGLGVKHKEEFLALGAAKPKKKPRKVEEVDATPDAPNDNEALTPEEKKEVAVLVKEIEEHVDTNKGLPEEAKTVIASRVQEIKKQIDN